MKKFLIICLTTFLSLCSAYATEEETLEPNEYDAIYNVYQAVYNPETQTWTAGGVADNDEIILTKQTIEGVSAYSQLFFPDNSLALTLSSDFEFIKDGKLVGVNNNELKFSQIIHNGEHFEEIPMSALEIQKLFPDTEVIRLSLIDSDNKMWLNKPFFKKKDFLFINDSDKSYYKLTPKVKKLQQSDIKCLITIPYFGMFTLTHFGERNGKIRIYVR